MQVQPYLFFDGRSDEAIEFYRSALGAEVTFLMRFKECPEKSSIPPGAADKVMHASLRIGDTTVMASDGECQGRANSGYFPVAHRADEAEAERLFDALADGGQIRVPLAKTFFSPRFGVVADRFGVP